MNNAVFLEAYYRLYSEGRTLRELANELGITLEEVYRKNNYLRCVKGIELPVMRRLHHGTLSAKEFANIYIEAYLQGKSYGEIAKQTGMTENAIKCRVYIERKRGQFFPKLRVGRKKIE